MSSPQYFPRHLLLQPRDGSGHARRIDEDELLAIQGPKIILGEPGMGKSELARELGRRLDVKVRTAMQFMVSMNPGRFVTTGKPLMIDGLDEAMARREGDAVDTIFEKLEAAGSPDFILCCRSREWQLRNAAVLQQIYESEPSILTLQALSSQEAYLFLSQRYPTVNAGHVLDHLVAQGMAELYENPLTLRLMGRVAESDLALPATRAALFERVCTLVWPEHDPLRSDSGLNKLSEEQALSAAGAISAGLLLAGADAVSLAGHGHTLEGDVRLAEIANLPGASAANEIFTSKLFQSVGLGRAKPIHRVMAEYLGARWLAQQAKTPRAQRRLLTQLQAGANVPASLRGLHAWLAFHSPAMAKNVIAADPFGVLRYGETTGLTAEQANTLFDALEALSSLDPYFRSQDWGAHSAAGLMSLPLKARIETVIMTPESNAHFRSLLVEGVQGTPLATIIAPALEKMMFSASYVYSERAAAAEALMPHRDRAWLRYAVLTLLEACTEESFHLARFLVEEAKCDVPDEMLVSTILASMGLCTCPLPQRHFQEFRAFRNHRPIVQMLDPERLVNLLNLFSEHGCLIPDGEIDNASSLAGLMALLISCVIEQNIISRDDAAALWTWLGVMRHLDPYDTDEKKGLQSWLDEADDVRRSVQHYALYGSGANQSIRMAEYELNDRLVGLRWHPKDLIWFVERLSGADVTDPKHRQDWCDLMEIGCVKNRFEPELREISRKFQAGDQELEAFIQKLENPPKPEYQIKRELALAQAAERARAANDSRRRYYKQHEALLRTGEPRLLTNPALIYLGVVPSLENSALEKDALTQWVGQELTDTIMAGFEALLHREDFPSAVTIAENFASDTILNVSFPIIAGLLARLRSGLALSDLASEVKRVGLLLCLNNTTALSVSELTCLRAALDPLVLTSDSDREQFARAWLEPSLRANRTQISGLSVLLTEEEWRFTGAHLAMAWLKEYPALTENVEYALVDTLIRAAHLDSLKAISQARCHAALSPVSRMLAWRAVDVMLRFDSVNPDLNDIADRHPEFIWHLRKYLQKGRRGSTRFVDSAKAKWIVSKFRTQWPLVTMPPSLEGDQNPYDATLFLHAMMSSIAGDTTPAASLALQELIEEPADGYTAHLLHMAAEQRQKRAEEHFASLLPKELGAMLSNGPPANMDDLRSLILEELLVAQQRLIGDDLDQARVFWNDNGVPHEENTCRDRLLEMIRPQLNVYEIHATTEVDMPKTKRADVAFARGHLQLPMEVKGQWHDDVWTAATLQLQERYLIDWRSQGCGIYCILWFGSLRSATRRRLKAPPAGVSAPRSATEMRESLIGMLPPDIRNLIDVVVIDFEAGKHK